MRDRNSTLTKQNEHNTRRRETTRARPRPLPAVRRGEQGEARRANSTPNGGLHFEKGRLRLKTWSKSDLSIAETTGRTYLYIFTAGAQPIDTLFFSFAIRRCVAHVPVRSY